MHLFSNGHCHLLPLLQSTTVIHHQETAQHGSSRALSGHRRQSSDDDADSLIRLNLGTTSRPESVADRHQADHDSLGHWTSACRITLADTGAANLYLAPERSAVVESLPETRFGAHSDISCFYETLSHSWDPSLGTSVPFLEQDSSQNHHASGPTFSTETYPGSYPMASIDYDSESQPGIAVHVTRQHANYKDARYEKCLIETCKGRTKGFARKYDRTRHDCPTGHVDLHFPKDASRDPQTASSEVTAASLTAQIVYMFVHTILSTMTSAVHLAQDDDPRKRDALGPLSSNRLVRV